MLSVPEYMRLFAPLIKPNPRIDGRRCSPPTTKSTDFAILGHLAME